MNEDQRVGPATIGDVARIAGVSRSTVSYALSGKRTISTETRTRIQEAISSIGFTPNAGARALATAQTKIIALMLQFHEDEFAPAMLEYLLPVTETARQHGYHTLLITDEDGPNALQNITNSGMVDGLILLDVVHEDERIPKLRAAQQPGVLVGLPGDHTGLDVFDLSFEIAATQVIHHYEKLGHQEVLLVTPPREVYRRGGAYAWRFRDAAIAAATTAGMKLHVEYGEAQQPQVEASIHKILDFHSNITGIIVHNDATIAALPHLLNKRGIRVPDDLSVVGVYSAHFAKMFSLSYTAIETSPDILAQRAVECLIARIQGKVAEVPPSVILINPELLYRSSTRSCK